MPETPFPDFPGLLAALYPKDRALAADKTELQDDMDGERQTFPENQQGVSEDDDDEDAGPDSPVEADDDAMAVDSIYGNVENLVGAVTTVAKGISDQTEAEYQRLAASCDVFLRAKGLITQGGTIFVKRPPKHAPYFAVLWIMNSCDRLTIEGAVKPASENPHSWGHAQKMRASLTYKWGHEHGLGTLPWHENDTGEMVGNPSVSPIVSRYMVSLRKRKTRAGEVATSARALTSNDLYELYHHNMDARKFPLGTTYSGPTRRGTSELEDGKWAGARQRRMLNCIYILAFLCLLRSDEVLNIRVEDIERDKGNDDKWTLHLPFRKTAQYGKVQPFVLWRMPEHLAHLCPVRALCEWLHVSQIKSGYLFRRFAPGDRVVTEGVRPLSSDSFLEMFRNNLLDLKIDPTPYGTHSFRRGGCQFYIVDRRWNIRKICEWGGWSREFSNLTIVKYIISWNDDPLDAREDFLNPNLKPALKCPSCGRSCHCA